MGCIDHRAPATTAWSINRCGSNLIFFILFLFTAEIRGGDLYGLPSAGLDRDQAFALIFELSGHGLNQLVGLFLQIILIDSLLDLKASHQRCDPIGNLDDRLLRGLHLCRCCDGLPLVSYPIEFL